MGKKRQKQHASKRFLKGASLKEKRERLGLSTWASGYGGYACTKISNNIAKLPLESCEQG